MRDNAFLSDRLNHIWQKYFADVPRANNVHIFFGRKARKRLGSIRQKLDQKDTLILINGHFKDKKIPSYVLDATIIHELCHYAHGFSSPLPQLSKYPHRGGLIDKEFEKRGAAEILNKESCWLNEKWYDHIENA